MRHLPPLIAVRAFEAAARHMNFTRAAAELCVTQTAISHQVKQLEQWLGSELFLRSGHSLRLTEKGYTYLSELTCLFDRLATVSSALKGRDNEPLRINVLASFATCWLMPRIGGFFKLHPDIRLKFSTATDSKAFTEDQFDLSIRIGRGRWQGLKADLIMHEGLTPMCSPRLLTGEQPFSQPSDLIHAVLLHDTPKEAWSRWFDYAGVVHPRPDLGIYFDDHSHLLQAAIDGQGVALGKLTLAEHALQKGELIQLFPIILPNDYSYWLVYPAAILNQANTIAFRAWLASEVKCRKA